MVGREVGGRCAGDRGEGGRWIGGWVKGREVDGWVRGGREGGRLG